MLLESGKQKRLTKERKRMADLILVPDPKGNPERTLNAKIEQVSRLVLKAESLLAQPVHNPEEIKALAAEMEEFKLKSWAKKLRELL